MVFATHKTYWPKVRVRAIFYSHYFLLTINSWSVKTFNRSQRKLLCNFMEPQKLNLTCLVSIYLVQSCFWTGMFLTTSLLATSLLTCLALDYVPACYLAADQVFSWLCSCLLPHCWPGFLLTMFLFATLLLTRFLLDYDSYLPTLLKTCLSCLFMDW